MPFFLCLVSYVMGPVFAPLTFVDVLAEEVQLEGPCRLARSVSTCMCCFDVTNLLLQRVFGGGHESAMLLSQLKLQPFEKQEKHTQQVRHLPAECLP